MSEEPLWGWPWHGLATQLPGSNEASIALPSGAAQRMPVVGGHWTYLWDVGRPDRESDSDDPDRAWWGKAILRGTGLPNQLYAYGGLNMNAGPIQFESGVGRLTLSISSKSDGAATLTVRGYLNLTGVPVSSTASIDISYPDVGADYLAPDGVYWPLRFTLVDRLPNGRAMLLRVSREYGFLIGAFETLAIIELIVGGEAAAITLTRTIHASGKDCQGRITVTEDQRQNRPPITTIGGSRARIGTAVSDSSVEATVWAWYEPGGDVQLMTYRARIRYSITETLTGSATQQNGTSRREVNMDIELAVGGVSASSTIQIEVSTQASVDNNDSSKAVLNVQGSMTLNGTTQKVLGGSENGQFTVIGPSDSVPPLDPELAARMQTLPWLRGAGTAWQIASRQSVLSWQALSNKVLCWALYYEDNINGDIYGPRRVTYTDALTPVGVDSGTYSRHTSEGLLDGFSRASYNPVTGAVRRNQNTPLYTWV